MSIIYGSQRCLLSVIVYTEYPIVNGVAGNASIYYLRVVNGQPTGSPVVVADSSQNQYLDDASGDYIVFTLVPSLGAHGNIVLYQISTNASHVLTGTGICISPHIYGNYVVWLEQRAAGTQLVFYDITTGFPVQNAVIAGRVPSIRDAAIGSR